MKISQYIDEQEAKWKSQTEEKCKEIINNLHTYINVNLYDQAKKEKAIDVFNYWKIYLFANFNDILYKSLIQAKVYINRFELEILNSFILSVTRSAKNVDFLKEILMKNGIIDEVVVDGNWYSIKSRLCEDIEFFNADEYIEKNKELKEYYEANIDIKSSCHETTLFLLKQNKEYKAVTAICKKNINESYYHSFILDNKNMVIDLTGNVIMPKDIYYLLYDVQELNVVTYDEFQEQEKLCEEYDESGTIMLLLRNAVYSLNKNDIISYEKFKELFNCLDGDRKPEILIIFRNRKEDYTLIKDKNKIKFGNESKVITYSNLDELYNAKTVDDIILRKEWSEIEDILIDLTFSVVNDKQMIENGYGVKI